jgi:hypothetical protein
MTLAGAEKRFMVSKPIAALFRTSTLRLLSLRYALG